MLNAQLVDYAATAPLRLLLTVTDTRPGTRVALGHRAVTFVAAEAAVADALV